MKRIFAVMLTGLTGLLLVAAGAGCSADKGASKQPDEIMVFAAASLTESFTELAKAFEEQQAGKVKVVFNFAGSQALATTFANGANADVLAFASRKNMDELKSKGLVGDYEIFVKNRLILILNKGSKYAVKSFSDLAADGMKIAIGDKTVPVGSYWEKVFDRAFKDGSIKADQKDRIETNIKTRELNVKDILAKVVMNEADGGIVYRTDITAAVSDKVTEVHLPGLDAVMAEYPLALAKASEDSAAARAFYEFVLSDAAKQVFKKYKFYFN